MKEPQAVKGGATKHKLETLTRYSGGRGKKIFSAVLKEIFFERVIPFLISLNRPLKQKFGNSDLDTNNIL